MPDGECDFIGASSEAYDQLEPSRAGQSAFEQGRTVAGDPGVDEQMVLVDQIQSVQLGRKLAATEEYAVRSRVLEVT